MSLFGLTQRSAFPGILIVSLIAGTLSASVKNSGINEQTLPVEIHVNLSCAGETKKGSYIELDRASLPDTTYTGLTDSTGTAFFPAVLPGQYTIRVRRFLYDPYTVVTNFTGPFTLTVNLNRIKRPVQGITVNYSNLLARWNPPMIDSVLLEEDWSGGSFSTNQWTVTGGVNWIISTWMGHPAPSAIFYWSPVVTNYQQFLTSRIIQPVHSNLLTFQYEVMLANFCPGQNLDVEISDGNGWQVLKSYNTWAGSIPWTLEKINITDYANSVFQIRFNSYGENSYNIQCWGIDNISLIASSDLSPVSVCIEDYSLSVNNNPLTSVPDTFFYIPPSLTTYGQSNQLCVDANYTNGSSPSTCLTFISGFLYPPGNPECIALNCIPQLSWIKPLTTSGTIPPGLSGYRLYRDGFFHLAIPDPNVLSFSDSSCPPGFFDYHLSASYDLAAYGFPGTTGESYAAGPVSVSLADGCMYPLPFFEDWGGGSFSGQNWTIEPDSGFWEMNLYEGNPAPAAWYFGQTPGIYNESSLISPVINATPYNCGKMTLSFDYRVDIYYTNSEYLYIDINTNGTWVQFAGIWHGSSSGWKTKHIDVTQVSDHEFQIRFTVSGLTSADPAVWALDNIRVQYECASPEELQANVEGTKVNLTWSPPECDWQNCTDWWYDDGIPENSFSPLPGENIWVGQHFEWWGGMKKIKYAQVWFTDNPQSGWDYLTIDVFDENHNFMGSSDPFKPVCKEWITVPLFGLELENECYLMVHWDSATRPTNSLGHDESNSYYWDDICYYFDGINWSTFSSVTGYDIGVFLLRIRFCSMNEGKDVTVPPGNESYDVFPETITLTGYDIYRTDNSGNPPFSRLNNDPIYDTDYVDTLPSGISSGIYKYYVSSIFHNPLTGETACESTGDTILIEPFTGTDQNGGNRLNLWPNPTEVTLCFNTSERVESVMIISLSGMKYPCSLVSKDEITYQISLCSYPPGIYLIQVKTQNEVLHAKIIKQ